MLVVFMKQPDNVIMVLGRLCYMKNEHIISTMESIVSTSTPVFEYNFSNGTPKRRDRIVKHYVSEYNTANYDYNAKYIRCEMGGTDWLLKHLKDDDGLLIHTSLLDYYNGQHESYLKEYYRFKLTKAETTISRKVNFVVYEQLESPILNTRMELSQTTLEAYAQLIRLQVDMGRFDEYVNDEEDNVVTFNFNNLVRIPFDKIPSLIKGIDHLIAQNIIMGIWKYHTE